MTGGENHFYEKIGYMEENRIRVIAKLTERRFKNLKTLAASKQRRQTINTDDEVGKNITVA